MSDTPPNTFLDAPLGITYLKTALPIIFMMAVSGLLAVADALFLGHYVGPQALAAVTLMFPAYMLMVALSTLVSSGMSSLLARHLGGNRIDEAQGVFAGAHGLALLVAAVLIVLFLLFGRQVTNLAAGGSDELADMGMIYLRITALFSPLLFVLSVNSDALRNEGRVGFMAAMGLLVSLANIGFNYVLIVLLDMGVAGSAYGTAMAQMLAFTIIMVFRLRGETNLRPSILLDHKLTTAWGRILALGAPQSLSFAGIAMGSAATMAALQIVDSPSYESTITAYGIITRVLTFAFLPLLGLSFAMQTITGNNFGAGKWQRTNQSLKIAIFAAFIYCGTLQILMMMYASEIGGIFVTDAAVINEVARILPVMILMFALAGPLMMISSYFQATGDATRAAILSLSKPFLFAIPLTFILSKVLGEVGIWRSGPYAELLLVVLTTFVLALTARLTPLRWGLFQPLPANAT